MARLLSLLAVFVGLANLAGAQDLQKGYEAFQARDYAAAMQVIKPLADQGSPTAQSLLGYMYLNGFGVRQDAVLALMWFKIAHENGNAFATRQVAFITKFMSPQGVSKAETKARDCLGSNYQTCGYGGFFVGWYDRWGVAATKHVLGLDLSER